MRRQRRPPSARRRQQLPVVLGDDVVHQILGGERRDEARDAADEHQPQAEREALAVRPDERAGFFPGARGEFLFRRIRCRGNTWMDGSGSAFGMWRHRAIIWQISDMRSGARSRGVRLRRCLAGSARWASRSSVDQTDAAAIMKADTDFNQALADRDLKRFLSFVASRDVQRRDARGHGRDAVPRLGAASDRDSSSA